MGRYTHLYLLPLPFRVCILSGVYGDVLLTGGFDVQHREQPAEARPEESPRQASDRQTQRRNAVVRSKGCLLLIYCFYFVGIYRKNS